MLMPGPTQKEIALAQIRKAIITLINDQLQARIDATYVGMNLEAMQVYQARRERIQSLVESLRVLLDVRQKVGNLALED